MLIKIKFLAPTNSRGSRYKATVKDGDNFQFSATVPSSYSTTNGDALVAAKAVAEKVRVAINDGVQMRKSYWVKSYDVEIVGSYDSDLFATMKTIYRA